MLRHDQIWAAIDGLAAQQGLSASGLARRAGLDPTTFNRSKRVTVDGRLRWPSTESIAKILTATSTSLDHFMAFLSTAPQAGDKTVPLLGLKEAEQEGMFDDQGYPAGDSWDEIAFPDLGESRVFALEVTEETATVLYRTGDMLVVSPGAALRRGDRVVTRLATGRIVMGELRRQTANAIDLLPLSEGGEPLSLPREQLDWIGRILWVSQ